MRVESAAQPTHAGVLSLVQPILSRLLQLPAGRSLLVALSGIDGAGKGHLARRLADALQQDGVNTALLGIDGWLNLPQRRFNPDSPAEHFYRHGLRLDEMFERLVLPLQRERSLRVEADLVTETATDYHRHVYDLQDVDVIVLEGIFLLKRAYQPYYDLSVWIDCSFETALERALARGQENLPPAETVRAYETIYFPAQRIHFRLDQPAAGADFRVNNDPRMLLRAAVGSGFEAVR